MVHRYKQAHEAMEEIVDVGSKHIQFDNPIMGQSWRILAEARKQMGMFEEAYQAAKHALDSTRGGLVQNDLQVALCHVALSECEKNLGK